MDRRKKRTSLNQYLMYIKKLEEDRAFRSGMIPSNGDVSFINNKWTDLANKLNTCNNGPSLSPEEWKKRLNDWKNSTRCKYRRTLAGEKDINMTQLELRALNLFGRIPSKTNNSSINIKNESGSIKNVDSSTEEEGRLVEEDGRLGEEDGSLVEEDVHLADEDSQLDEDDSTFDGIIIETVRTFDDDQNHPEDENNEIPENERSVTAANVTLNGEPPAKKSRLHEPSPSAGAQAIASQLKRIADIKHKKLVFEIAKFKFRNPGFDFKV